MPGKRKRDESDQGHYGARNPHSAGNKQIAEAKIHHGKQLLSRALKLAKGFERQKLSRRLKNAEKEKKDADIQRINAEIEALKLLDLHAASEIHVHKAILKEKALRESPLLPAQVPEKARVNLNNATANITARLWASAPVKKVMAELMVPIRKALVGHDAAANPVNGKPAITRDTDSDDLRDALHDRRVAGSDDDSGSGSEGAGGDDDDDQDEEEQDQEETEDDTDFAAFDDRIGASSDDESLDLEAAKANAANRRAADLSLSPSPPHTDDSADSAASASDIGSALDDQDSQSSALKSDTHSEQNDAAANTKARPTTKPAAVRDLFLPSLTSGYISASDESASDLEADAASTRKNRRGQRARQKIWEAKYGAKAKHVETAAKKGGGRDQGWDMKRGARAEGDDAHFRGRGRGGGFGNSGKRVTTGANEEQVVPRAGRAVAAGRGGRAAAPNRAERRAGGDKQKEKQAPLHPSWEAARRAKEAKAASVGFTGTKVTFD